MRFATFAAAASFALSSFAAPVSAEAKGCLKGAVMGGLAGHFAGRHGVLGAIGGCVVGYRMANEKTRRAPPQSVRSQRSSTAANGD